MPPRPCLKCGTPTNTTRCAACESQHQHTRNTTRPHLKGDWPTLSRQIRAQHVAQHGWVCPGWDTPPHPSTDLTVDHITQRSASDGYRVLCRSCNSRKSVTERTA